MADEPARPRTIVKVSDDTNVTKTISSLEVSGSSATVNWSGYTPPTAEPRVTPPRRAEAVPVATVIVVAELEMPEASVVFTLMLEYLRVIYFP